MRKSLYAVLAALFVLIAVSGCTQVRFYDPNEGEGTVPVGNPVSSIDELKAAADGAGTYYLTKDIILDEMLTITKGITLDGNGHTISRSAIPSTEDVGDKAVLFIESSNVEIKNITISSIDSTTGWDKGEYAVKVYGTIASEHISNIVFEDVEIASANAGMLIRYADVTFKGDIVLNDLGYGGINVDSKDVGSARSSLDVTNCKFKSTPMLRDLPAIWKEHKTATNESVTGWERIGLEQLEHETQLYYVTHSYNG